MPDAISRPDCCDSKLKHADSTAVKSDTSTAGGDVPVPAHSKSFQTISKYFDANNTNTTMLTAAR